MIEIKELGEVVAEQMEAVEKDFEGREEDFEYEGSVSLLVYKDRRSPVPIAQIRARTSMCPACTLKAYHMAMENHMLEIQCLGEEQEDS